MWLLHNKGGGFLALWDFQMCLFLTCIYIKTILPHNHCDTQDKPSIGLQHYSGYNKKD